MLSPSRSRIVVWIEQKLGTIAVSAYRHPFMTLGLVAVACVVSLWAARNLSLNANLTELLPKSFPSVQELQVVKERFGGIGYVVVVGQNAELQSLKAFADDIVPKIESLSSILYVQYLRPVAFFEDRLLYFLDVKDLKKVHEKLAARYEWERLNKNPLYLDLDDSKPPSLDFSELQGSYATRSDQQWMHSQLGERYYVDPEKKLIALLAKPASASGELAASKQVVKEVKTLLAKHNLSAYDPHMTLGYTGRYVRKVDQQNLIANDLRFASIAAFFLVLLYIGLHFRRVLAVFLISIPLLVGLIWTFGFAGTAFGTLNILTGFIGAILLGLGIDHGIHLLGRHEIERSKSNKAEEVIHKSFGHTGRAVIVAALTTSIGFAGLGLSEFRAFREFGIISSVGIVFLVIAFVICLPAMLGIAEQKGWKPSPKNVAQRSWLAQFVYCRAPWILLVSLCLFFVLLSSARHIHFDYDFRSLEDHQIPSFVLDRDVNQILGFSQTPVVVLTNSLEEERFVANALRKRQSELGEKSTIDIVVASSDLIPLMQEEKQPIIKEIGAITRKIKAKWLEPEYRTHLKTLKRMVSAPPFGRKDLPLDVRRQFQGREKDKDSGFVLVFAGVELSNGAEVSRFGREVRNIKMPDGKTLSASGEIMILADIYDMVARETKPVLTITLLAVFAILWILMGNLRLTLLCLTPAVVTMVITGGLLPLVDLDLNYLNIVMIPVLFGIGVDAGIHLVTRLRNETDFVYIVSEIGRAISGAIVTTGLGFVALLLADHPGLNSLGKLALLGLGVNAFASLVGLASFLAWRRSKKRVKTL